MKKEEIVELLAPAGSPEGYYGAVNAGADAVYLGGREFGARAYADNFSEEELLSCLRHAHIFHKKIYLTVNTLVKEEEMERLIPFLKPFAEEGLDGVIVQDFGVLRRIHEEFPGLALHASTQMNLTGVYGAKQLKRFGVSRIVPARELSLEEVRQLVRSSGMEVECFIHGAMCYSYSGQCLFSSILGGRSGNRGRCAQPCRLPYQTERVSTVSIKDKGRGSEKGQKEVYPLSLKDMCALELIPELVSAGVKSFKIEGRMKKPEYVAACVRAYRNVVDLWYDKRNPSDDGNAMNRKRKADEYVSGATEVLKNPSIDSQQEKITEKAELEMIAHQYKQEMAEVFNRGGFTKGYFYRHNGKEMMSIKNPGNVGVVIGTVVDIRKNQICVRLDQTVYKGDILVLDGKKQEITLTSNIQASEGEIITLNAPRIQEIRKKQTVRRMLQYPLMK